MINMKPNWIQLSSITSLRLYMRGITKIFCCLWSQLGLFFWSWCVRGKSLTEEWYRPLHRQSTVDQAAGEIAEKSVSMAIELSGPAKCWWNIAWLGSKTMSCIDLPGWPFLVGGFKYFLFFHLLGGSSSQLTLTPSFFQRGRSTTNQFLFNAFKASDG